MERRRIPLEDIQLKKIPRIEGEYKDGVYCKCGMSIIFKNRKPYEPVLITCPLCGFEIYYG